MTSTGLSMACNVFIVRVTGGVKHNRSIFGIVIETRLETIHPQTLPMPARVGLVGHQQADVGLVAIHSIAGRIHFPVVIAIGTPSVGCEFMKQQFLLCEIDDPKSLLVTRQLVVNNCYDWAG